MKTPRDILLNRHQAAETNLDRIRREAVRAAADVNRQGSSVRELTFAATVIRPLTVLWRELVLPARRTWAGITGVWVVILGVNFAMREPVPANLACQSPPPSPQMRALLKQQEQLFAELVGPIEKREADRPRPVAPQPRSQRREEFLNA